VENQIQINSLLEEDKDFIGPLLIIGGVLAVGFVFFSLFMPTVSWVF
jgi:hypothetical protein